MSKFLLVLALLSSAPGAGLRLHVSTPHKLVLAGEPFKLVVQWTVERDASVAVETPDFLRGSLRLRVHGPEGFGFYEEFPRVQGETLIAPAIAMKRNERLVTNLVFVHGGYLDNQTSRSGPERTALLFPQAGRYVITALYTKEGNSIESNSIEVSVILPADPLDAQILSVARERPGCFTQLGAPVDAVARRAESLRVERPTSPYWRWSRITEIEDCLNGVSACGTEFNPGEYAPGLQRNEVITLRSRRLARLLLEDEDWGPFEEEALRLGHEHAQRVGWTDIAERARQQLYVKYPDSASARELKRRETDAAPSP